MNHLFIYRTIILLLFITLSQYTFGQKFKKPKNLPRYDFKEMHFGFLLGINSLDFDEKRLVKFLSNDSLNVIQSRNQFGFNLGIVSNYRIGSNSDLRFTPSLIFGERHIDFYKKNDQTITKIIESTLIEFPVNIKYKSDRYNNFRIYILSGFKYSLDIASQKEVNNADLEIIKLKKNDFLSEIGLGFDFYLPYFKFSPQLKLSFGLVDVLANNEIYLTDYFRNLNSRNWSLCFTFE